MEQARIVAQIPGLRRYARSLTGNAWVADDLVQDTLERACSKWRLWTPDSDLRAWLFTLMHNLFANDTRRSSRRRDAGAQVDLEDVPSELTSPDAGLDIAIDLQRCLLQLPEEQREVLLLATLEDMSYEDIARVTGAPIGTVMSRLSRARVRLQLLLDAPAHDAGPTTAPGSKVLPLRRLK